MQLNMTSLFTNTETIKIISKIHCIPPDTVKLIEQPMTSTYVIDETPLPPAIVNFFVNQSEKNAIDNFHLKPTCCRRYVDDVIVIWPHDKQHLENFTNLSTPYIPK